LINACIEIGCGGLGFSVALGVELAPGRAAVVDGDGVGAEATVGVEAGGVRTLVGSVALQAASTRATGSTQSAFM
jgi:hypothetical protein